MLSGVENHNLLIGHTSAFRLMCLAPPSTTAVSDGAFCWVTTTDYGLMWLHSTWNLIRKLHVVKQKQSVIIKYCVDSPCDSSSQLALFIDNGN